MDKKNEGLASHWMRNGELEPSDGGEVAKLGMHVSFERGGEDT